ncbi:MAG: addiction module protein [Deltaproteobacteria bacterium]|nr:addiction module protein [Deltaproteobacteria bacterium]
MSIDQARALMLALPPSERLAFAVELLESTEPEDDGVEQAWEDEIGRRVERIDRGEAQMLSNTDVLARIGRTPRS